MGGGRRLRVVGGVGGKQFLALAKTQGPIKCTILQSMIRNNAVYLHIIMILWRWAIWKARRGMQE